MPPKAAQKEKGSAQKEKGSAQKEKGSAQKSGAAAGAAANKNWEAGLIKAQLEEDSWPVCVCFVVGSSPADEELVQALAVAFQRHQYRQFTMLNWDNTLAKIHELGNPKAKKTDNVPLFYEVTESAKVLLDAGNEIPCDLMAKVLKFQLLQVKVVDQQRREAEMNSADGLVYSSEKKTKLKRRDDVDPPKFKDEEPDGGPQHSILVLGFYQPQLIGALEAIGVHVANVIKLCSERTQTSEEHQEQHASDGSEQSRVTSPALDSDSARQEQAAQARRLHLFWSGLRSVLDTAPLTSKLHDVAQFSYTVPDVLPCSHNLDPEATLELGSRILEGVACTILDCLVWRRQHQHYLDNLRLISVPAVVKVDSQALEAGPASLPRAAMTPRSRMKSVQEEDPSQDAKSRPVSVNVDMRYYSNLLDLVPPEACSVPLLLDCMLEQVVISTEHAGTEKNEPCDGPWLDPHLGTYMLQSFLPLVQTDEERRTVLRGLLSMTRSQEDQKRLAQVFGAGATQTSEHPLIVRHHDERALRLKDVTAAEGFDPAEVEASVMRLSPAWRLIESVAHQQSRNSCWMAVKQQLQHYCTDDMVSWADVERLVHQSVLESMPLSRLDQNGVLLKSLGPQGAVEATLQQTPTIIPWDNPPDYAQQQLHTRRAEGPTFITEDSSNTKHLSGRASSQVDLSDIQSCRLRSLFDWYCSERHSASVFPQVLQLASEEYCCLDTFRANHRNILYIFCHNPMSPSRQCKEIWDVSLHTDVKFRKYLEHVADAISDWTREEELKREETSSVASTTDETTSEAAEETDALEPVIRKDSLKAWKQEQESLKMEELAKKLKKESAPKGKQPTEVDKLDNKTSKTSPAGKKIRSEMGSSSEKSIPTTAPPVEEKHERHQAEEAFKCFTGYSMDGKLIHVSGRLQHLFPSDGGHITVENISYVEGSSLVKLAVKKDGHHFHTHINHRVVDSVKPPTHLQYRETSDMKEECQGAESVELKTVKQASLSAVLNNGIRLSYSVYGPTGQYIVTPQEAGGAIPQSSTAVPVPLGSVVQQEKESTVCDDQTALASKPFNSLNLCVPNGLLLQLLREDTQGVSSEEQGMLVRQSFPLRGRGGVKHPQDPSLYKELSRVITSQGAVIRSMSDGSTEVLFADGSVSFSQDGGPVWVPDSEVDVTSQEAENNKKEPSSSEDSQRGCWTTTTPSGARICTVGTTHKHIPTTPLLTYKATDPITHEVMLSREDLVVSVQNPDGSFIVEHADGTRITSIFQNRPPSTQHILLLTGEPKSVTLKSTSECVCGRVECVCVTRCAVSINENMDIHSTCDTREEIGRDSTKTACDKDSAGQACAKLSESEVTCDEHAERSASKNVDKGVFAEEAVAKIVKRNTCEDEKVTESIKEQVFVVEKEGCATVVMYPEQHAAHLFLADGTAVTGNNQGDYQVFPSNAGLLHIQSDGKCVYTSDSPVTPSPKSGTPTSPPGRYTFSHSDKVMCDITDRDGNHFQVTEDGQVSVLNFSPAPSTMKLDEEELEEEEREMNGIRVNHREHRPRLFVVHEDGSATELLSSQTVEELLCQACSDPAIALLKEPLPDTQDEFGLTILKPSHQSVWSKWLLGKQNPDITPPNLRNHGWHGFPGVETKTPDPPVGTNVGRGLTLSESFGGTAAQHPCVRSCPKVLEMRELYQHRPLTTPLKNTVDKRLKEYIECLMEREQRSEEIRVKDPRTEEESAHASALLSLVLSFAEEEDKGHAFDKRPEDISSLYSKGIKAQQSDFSEDTATSASDSFTKRRESKWTESLSQYRQELFEEKACKEALRKKSIVPYFHAENGPIFQNLLQQQPPDMKALSMNLPPIPKSERAELFLRDAPADTPRPVNPAASESASCAAALDRPPKERPTDPTPQTDGGSRLRSSSVPYKSVHVDVAGKPRKTKVRLPTSILSSKPHSVPNQRFLSLEEPVRRKCRTISLTHPNVVVRGFVLLPSSVDFGTMQEGTSSTATVVMKNVGVDTCRFHVKQPPPATGLRVIYNPGPVPAGLQVELKVQLFAIRGVQAGAAEPRTRICQDVIIRTETDILYLPVSASVLSDSLYQLWLQDQPSAQRKGSRRMKPSAAEAAGQRLAHT